MSAGRPNSPGCNDAARGGDYFSKVASNEKIIMGRASPIRGFCRRKTSLGHFCQSQKLPVIPRGQKGMGIIALSETSRLSLSTWLLSMQ